MSTVIAVDAMGGDRAPGAVVDGAVQAVARHGVGVVLVGPAAVLEAELARHDAAARASVARRRRARRRSRMDEAPLAALRRKPPVVDSRRRRLGRGGRGRTRCSAPATPARPLLAAHAAFGAARGVDRPALAVTVPTLAGAAVLLDAGASLECRPEHLVQFATMGSAYARGVA